MRPSCAARPRTARMRDLPFQRCSAAIAEAASRRDVRRRSPRRDAVVGSRTPNGVPRLGVDRERRIAIDHGALRFQPLVKPGWGRQGIAYGPFRAPARPRRSPSRSPTATTPPRAPCIDEGIARRIWRWVRGPGADPVPRSARGRSCAGRASAVSRGGSTGGCASTPLLYNRPDIDENLAVGWFGGDASRRPDRAKAAASWCMRRSATTANSGCAATTAASRRSGA